MATRATIRGLARIRADQTNSTFPTDTECNTIIDSVAARVWRKLFKAGWKPGQDTVSITASGLFKYAVANNALSVQDVFRVDGTTRTSLARMKPEERGTYISMGTGPAEVYDLFSGVVIADGVTSLQIELYPRPTSGSYEVYLIETFGGFTADGDTWTGPPGSDELIALGAAIQMLGKEGDIEMMRTLKSEYDELYVEICEDAGWIDAKHTPTVRDVSGISARDPYDWSASEGWC